MPETTPAGATPAAADATSTQTTPVSPAAGDPKTSASSATDEPEELRDPGKRAIDRMKGERDAALEAAKLEHTEAEALRNASRTDQEKAIAAARKEAAAEVTTAFEAKLRQARVEAALAQAGVEPSLLDLASNAGEFAKLKLTDDGHVDGLDEAIAELRTVRPALFKTPVAGGTADGGTRGTPGLTRDQIKAMTPDEINARWAEVSKALEGTAR